MFEITPSLISHKKTWTNLPVDQAINKSIEGIEIWNRTWKTVKHRLFPEDPQVLGHFDVIGRQNHKKLFKNQYQYWYFPPGEEYDPNLMKSHEIKVFNKPVIGLDEMFKRDNGRVLDIGCGGGEEAFGLADEYRQLKIDAFDYELGKGVPFPVNKLTNLTFHNMDWRNLDFADNSFDVLISDQGIARYGSSREIIKEMTRVAKVGAVARFSGDRGIADRPNFYNLLAEQGWEVFLLRYPSGANSQISVARLVKK